MLKPIILGSPPVPLAGVKILLAGGGMIGLVGPACTVGVGGCTVAVLVSTGTGADSLTVGAFPNPSVNGCNIRSVVSCGVPGAAGPGCVREGMLRAILEISIGTAPLVAPGTATFARDLGGRVGIPVVAILEVMSAKVKVCHRIAKSDERATSANMKQATMRQSPTERKDKISMKILVKKEGAGYSN